MNLSLENFLFRLKNKLSAVLLSQQIYANGKKINLPIIDGSSCDLSEPWMATLLKQLLLNIPEGIFLDIGVNLGQTLIKVKSICAARHYVGIEPNPFCVYYTRRLIKINCYRDATIIPAALSNTSQIVDLFSFSNSSSDSSASIIHDFRGQELVKHSSCVVTIGGIQLSNYLGAASISIIKIDVEGAELECLYSLQNMISGQKPLILVEILPLYTAANTFRLQRQVKIEAFCEQQGYIIFRIKKDSLDRFICLERLDKIGAHSDLSQCDYILVSQDRVLQQLSGLLH